MLISLLTNGAKAARYTEPFEQIDRTQFICINLSHKRLRWVSTLPFVVLARKWNGRAWAQRASSSPPPFAPLFYQSPPYMPTSSPALLWQRLLSLSLLCEKRNCFEELFSRSRDHYGLQTAETLQKHHNSLQLFFLCKVIFQCALINKSSPATSLLLSKIHGP